MAETVIPSNDQAATDAAVEAALGTGYVIAHDDGAGTATIDAPELDEAGLTAAVESIG